MSLRFKFPFIDVLRREELTEEMTVIIESKGRNGNYSYGYTRSEVECSWNSEPAKSNRYTKCKLLINGI